MLVIDPSIRPLVREAYQHAKRLGPDVTRKFLQTLLHCHRYGAYSGDGIDPVARQNTKFTLFKDFAPHSFTFMVQRQMPDGTWRFLFNGGLIYQGPESPADGSGPSFTVSLNSGIGWFMHT